MQIFKIAISKILDFSAGSKVAIKLLKTVIECFFCYPLVKSRGQPTPTYIIYYRPYIRYIWAISNGQNFEFSKIWSLISYGNNNVILA